uniref:Uncharacterized protein n=1 Tax=Rhizophora mucronata TaxID=61149 RepID=A0A2P2NVB6_RHIMU
MYYTDESKWPLMPTVFSQ